ncbi:MAG: magnesium transporter [Clostridiales bacterium]|nr:magnesium transporter [Clostridiales bacterium]
MEWEAVEKRLNDLLHSGKKEELRGAMRMLHEADIAQYMENLDQDQLLKVFRILPKDISADVFSYMSPEQRQLLIESIGDQEIRALVDDMFLDDAVDFLEELPAGVVRRVLQSAAPEKRQLINQFLRYPEDSAGSIMTIEYLEFHRGDTVKKAMETIREVGLDKETIYTLYILDKNRGLIGTLPLRKMILAREDAELSEMMEANPISVFTTDSKEKVAEVVRRYDLMAIPVVDRENRLVGIITADDVMDVIEEKNTEDFERMAALTPSEDEYLRTSPFKLALNRIPWLLIMAAVAMLTGMIIDSYEGLLKNASIVLTSCIPMLMNTGGNCGSQASTLMIRGIALGEIRFQDIFRAAWKELRVGLMVGAVLFLFTFLLVFLIYQAPPQVALIVALALYCTVLIAKALGCMLPLCAKKVGFDPALMASPLITTLVDAASLTIYFAIATMILRVLPV